MSDDRNLPDTMADPGTGSILRRDVRPFIVSYGGQSTTVDLPGYYPDGEGDGVLIGGDMRAAGEALKKLKVAKHNLK
ncbi:MAG: hypothetical protein WDN02_02745 [Methylovirgula sp.]|uniref:hypothetical protein n=1 Tax=Methylovirgula sp. TaxID=1978224 RepID=UPI00307607A8